MALELAPEERTQLAQEIWSSLDISAVDEDPGWTAELDRRIDEIETGAVKGLSWDEVRAQILDPDRPRRR